MKRPISLRKRKRLTTIVQATLFETLADLLNNGFSLRQAMQFVVDVQGPTYQRLRPVLARLAAGDSLATALQPYIMIDLYYQLMIAEMHGELMTTLTQAGQLMRTKANQARQVKRLLQYPCLLLVLLLGTLILVKTAVLPNFSAITAVPAQSQVWKLLLAGAGMVVGLGIAAALIQLKRLPIRLRYQWLARLPLVGPLIKNYCGYYLSLNAGMLLAGGLGIRAICEISRQFKSQSLLQQQGVAVEQALLSGQSLTTIIRSERLLPDELALLVSKESPAEQMSRELLYFATIQYERLIRQLNRIISWIQPLMFILIAAVVVGTYMNLLLPMYNSMGEILK
ncbi:type II secretion system F family protein [Lactiplantibacillus herbarum]|uniref:type II secretion system F family protein n=1 Tax=Lactiplantibacillus herbarum TaxID=1670446 RepID=UPI00064FC17A|nr:type II secretion system F family protein [Lactiplantibacillus herbarum]